MMKLLNFERVENKNLRLEEMDSEYKAYISELAGNDPWYPSYHVAPKHGLLNDPNGLSYIDGKYHIFYQWYPFGPVHGLKYWYHVTTKDFIHYEDKGIGIAPDMPFDDNGCYSGMMLHHQVYYTGVSGDEKFPSVCKADFEGEKVVNKRRLFPMDPTVTTRNFRDPFVWKKDEQYYMINGGESKENRGVITVHQSSDGENYIYKGLLKISESPEAYMYECPNYVELEGNGLLIFSPQGMKNESKYDYRNVFSVVYSVGKVLNVKENIFCNQGYFEVDKGFDFYAPQVFEDGKRTLMIGWLGNSKCVYPSDKNQWAHMLTIPREISLDGECLIQRPIPELEKLRQKKVHLEEKIPLESCAFEINLKSSEHFELKIGNAQGQYLLFSANEEEYCLDRGKTTFPFNDKYGHQRYAKRVDRKSDVRIYVDHSAIEIFCDHGRTVFTGRFFIEDFNNADLIGTEGELYYLDAIKMRESI